MKKKKLKSFIYGMILQKLHLQIRFISSAVWNLFYFGTIFLFLRFSFSVSKHSNCMSKGNQLNDVDYVNWARVSEKSTWSNKNLFMFCVIPSGMCRRNKIEIINACFWNYFMVAILPIYCVNFAVWLWCNCNCNELVFKLKLNGGKMPEKSSTRVMKAFFVLGCRENDIKFQPNYKIHWWNSF